ncbi:MULTISPECIES: hypothetical protein [unclassified Streptomyces]|uniref:hypothetical protein n=1 Tax=unclassified Streptomyces TaxID=2593676 RepID=UPI002E805F02|nr:hypothetical protein [Streptomyces sp. NBC_00589]WTI38664.1 hypothetical protein OIC96_28595 [Streptomyces sp. NBC_00775]WUB27657.1 hypothetical protein OHA51_21140 [Streptomyces sp. NBC_00589]
MRRTALAALCLAAAATAGLTGCLSGENKADSKPKGPFAGLTGGEIADRAVKATTGANSLRMKGDVPDDEDGGTIGIDMALNKKGECAGTMSMAGQGKADLIKTGDTVYMKYDEAFLRAQGKGESKSETDGVVELLAGKWTKMSATGSDAKDIAGFCDLDSVLADAKNVNSDATRGKTTTIDGTPAIVLHEKDGKDRYTLYVATEGKPYLLRVDSTSAKDPGSLTFSEYEKPVPAEKPAGKILDLDKLGG